MTERDALMVLDGLQRDAVGGGFGQVADDVDVVRLNDGNVKAAAARLRTGGHGDRIREALDVLSAYGRLGRDPEAVATRRRRRGR